MATQEWSGGARTAVYVGRVKRRPHDSQGCQLLELLDGWQGVFAHNEEDHGRTDAMYHIRTGPVAKRELLKSMLD